MTVKLLKTMPEKDDPCILSKAHESMGFGNSKKNCLVRRCWHVEAKSYSSFHVRFVNESTSK